MPGSRLQQPAHGRCSERALVHPGPRSCLRSPEVVDALWEQTMTGRRCHRARSSRGDRLRRQRGRNLTIARPFFTPIHLARVMADLFRPTTFRQGGRPELRHWPPARWQRTDLLQSLTEPDPAGCTFEQTASSTSSPRRKIAGGAFPLIGYGMSESWPWAGCAMPAPFRGSNLPKDPVLRCAGERL